MRKFGIHYRQGFLLLSLALQGCATTPASRAPAAAAEASVAAAASEQVSAKHKLVGETLMKQREIQFEKNFSQREHDSFAAFEKRALSLPKSALGEVFQNDAFSFGLRAFQKDRDSILQRGVLNQYATHTSGAFYGTKVRATAEARMLQMPMASYDSLANDVKPKYGYLRVKDDNASGIQNHDGITGSYGEDIYLFRASAVTPRLSFSLGDSLNRLDEAPKGSNLSWEFTFIPWKFKSILLPVMLDNVQDTQEFYLGKGLPNDLIKRDLGLTTARYVELQFWGPIDLDDVESFYFTDQPPAGEFLEALKSRKIRIFKDNLEEVGGQLVEWVPPAP